MRWDPGLLLGRGNTLAFGDWDMVGMGYTAAGWLVGWALGTKDMSCEGLVGGILLRPTKSSLNALEGEYSAIPTLHALPEILTPHPPPASSLLRQDGLTIRNPIPLQQPEYTPSTTESKRNESSTRVVSFSSRLKRKVSWYPYSPSVSRRGKEAYARARKKEMGRPLSSQLYAKGSVHHHTCLPCCAKPFYGTKQPCESGELHIDREILVVGEGKLSSKP